MAPPCSCEESKPDKLTKSYRDFGSPKVVRDAIAAPMSTEAEKAVVPADIDSTMAAKSMGEARKKSETLLETTVTDEQDLVKRRQALRLSHQVLEREGERGNLSPKLQLRVLKADRAAEEVQEAASTLHVLESEHKAQVELHAQAAISERQAAEALRLTDAKIVEDRPAYELEALERELSLNRDRERRLRSEAKTHRASIKSSEGKLDEGRRALARKKSQMDAEIFKASVEAVETLESAADLSENQKVALQGLRETSAYPLSFAHVANTKLGRITSPYQPSFDTSHCYSLANVTAESVNRLAIARCPMREGSCPQVSVESCTFMEVDAGKLVSEDSLRDLF